jgi:hypothetical protein
MAEEEKRTTTKTAMSAKAKAPQRIRRRRGNGSILEQPGHQRLLARRELQYSHRFIRKSRWTDLLMSTKSINPSNADFQCDLQKCDETAEKRDEMAVGGGMEPSRRRWARRRMTD